MHLRHVAERLRYLASNVDPEELDHELHALARACEDASEAPPTPGMVAAAPEMYRALGQIVEILHQRNRRTDQIHRIATIALAHADTNPSKQ